MKQGILIGVLLGFFLGAIVTSIVSNKKPIQEKEQIKSQKDQTMMHTMEKMETSLIGKTGEELEKAFLEEMIIHHEGAIDMASLLKEGAVHEELKQLADEIITAQSKEITQMKEWQTEWKYTSKTP